jgi:hypothetical protein
MGGRGRGAGPGGMASDWRLMRGETLLNTVGNAYAYYGIKSNIANNKQSSKHFNDFINDLMAASSPRTNITR